MGRHEQTGGLVSRHDCVVCARADEPECMLRLVGLLQSIRPELRTQERLADVGALRDGAARNWPTVGPSWHGSNRAAGRRWQQGLSGCQMDEGGAVERRLLT